MFENIIVVLVDLILGLVDLFCVDDCFEKINFGIGVYKDEIGKMFVLISVKKVEQYLLENEMIKNYLGIDGIFEFGCCIQELLFGKGNVIIVDKCVCIVQILGGIGVLCVVVDFFVKNIDVKCVWVSNLSWLNYKSVFIFVGLEVCEYVYYDVVNYVLDFDGLLVSLNEVQVGDVVLFYGCCYNLIGIDLIFDQWQQLVQLLVEKGWLLLFDFVYQGFVCGLEEDVEGLCVFVVLYKELLVVSFYLKNFGLYNECVGVCILVVVD